MNFRRWGYHDVNETREQVRKMREANIPLEGAPHVSIFLCSSNCGTVIWNDIDLYRKCETSKILTSVK